ncbi:MAG: hypothetical protein K1X55_17495 [Chitinophagales bacterium]|nr:hypothetical protein [Chitinophagales bacterium]
MSAVSQYNPERKLQPLGFLQMILSTMEGRAELKPINNDLYDQGHERDLKVYYRKRPTKSEVRTTESGCDVASPRAREEFNLPALDHAEVSFWMPDALIRQYEKDASQNIVINQQTGRVDQFKGQTAVMKEVYDNLFMYAGVLLAKINEMLVADMATQFGVNVTTGNNAAKPLSFQIGTVALQDALVQLLSDFRENEMDMVSICGNGAFANWDVIRDIYSTFPNLQGVNMQAMSGKLPKVWYDKDTAGIWGANQVGVFEKGSIELLTRNKYIGNFKSRLGTSSFFTMAMPVNELAVPQQFLDRMLLDVQIKEVDCPTEITIDGTPTTVTEGIIIFLKKKFKLFVAPDMYDATDSLAGSNGTLRYELTGCTEGCA